MPTLQSHARPADAGRPLHAYDPARGVELACPHCAAAVAVADPIHNYAYYEPARCPACTAAFFLELYTVGDWNCFRLVEEY